MDKLFQKVEFAPKAVEDMVRKKLNDALNRVGAIVARDVITSFGSPPPMPKGATYGEGRKKGQKVKPKDFRKMFHSQPGDPPFVQLGTLRRSISFDRPTDYRVRVGSSLKPFKSEHSYAWYLEYGTKKMAPRPYLRPAVERNRSRIMKEFANASRST